MPRPDDHPFAVIDLHTHTDASDGRLPAADLVRHAWMAGIRVLAVTDHDTMGAVRQATEAARAFGLRLVPGVEVTAIESGADIHVLAYFIDPDEPTFASFLAAQRRARIDRLREIGVRLAALGVAIDTDALLATRDGKEDAIGRPAIAAALVAAGHARSTADAFDRYLARKGAAFVPRPGPSVPEVIECVHTAGGLAVIAHPGVNGRDDRIPVWAEAGLDGLEVHHSDHDQVAVARYRAMASDLGLAITGGSDYHGDERAERARLGRISLPPEHFAALEQRAARAVRAHAEAPADTPQA